MKRGLSGAIAAAVLALAAAGCASSPHIIDRPIPFSEARRAATLDYIGSHYGERPDEISIVPRILVLHWTAIPSLEGSMAAFTPEELPGSRPDLEAAGRVNVSIQFLVDRDGTIYRLMPETWMARHVIGLNTSSIGIENVGGDDGIDDMTDSQITANIDLVRYLARKYPTLDYLIGHLEYRVFENHPLWLELDPAYRTEKSDPGDRFMTAVRGGLADLGLKGTDEIRAEAAASSRARQQK